MTKGWQQWRELERHLHSITVADVLKAQIYTGRLQEFDEALPAGLFKKLSAIWRHRHTRRAYGRHIRKVEDNFKDMTKLHEASSGGNENPLDNPFITWYSYYFDLLASAYGLAVDEFNNLPFASLNEFKLAISARQASESGRRSLEANLNEKGAKHLKKYARREVDQEVYMSLIKSKDDVKKHLDNHFKGKEKIYKN